MTHVDNVAVGAALMWLTVLGVLEQDAVHVSAGVLEQLVGMVEYDQRDLAVTQNAQLIRLLHQPKLALRERHLYNIITGDVSEFERCWNPTIFIIIIIIILFAQ